ncbi:cytochrome p450 [Trifolium pratense]|uniref:Cytochrome p450 n=1 Tax=Trifolium pratense TaxID=57577 RepID=A0A2K3MV96_TRIPR|nr:cytochrome p450 [Trifolium pratense]
MTNLHRETCGALEVNRWRIGNRTNISLWNENWLANVLPLEAVNNNDVYYADFFVSDIMEVNSKEWNTNIVLSLFDQTYAARILDTPLYPPIKDDKRIWHGESRLRAIGVKCLTDYAFCHVEEEDSKHVFFTCPSSQIVWSMSVFFQVVHSAANSEDDAKTIIFHILKQLSKNDVAMFACILWSIWKQRNNQIWNNVTDAQSFVFSRAATMLQDWRAVCAAATTSSQVAQAEVQRTWRKSMAGRVKCNVDA